LVKEELQFVQVQGVARQKHILHIVLPLVQVVAVVVAVVAVVVAVVVVVVLAVAFVPDEIEYENEH